jgi:hypothetical protein
MHDCRDHVHFHFNKESINKESMEMKLNEVNKFKGFDDFMYFSYKHWFLIREDNEKLEKSKNMFIEAAKKFNKFRNLDSNQLLAEADKYITHLNEITRLLFELDDIHNATVKIGQFAKSFTIEDKFIRNFNKKLESIEI